MLLKVLPLCAMVVLAMTGVAIARENPRLEKLRAGRRLVFSGYQYPLTIPEDQFRQLIGFLKDHGYSGFVTYIQWNKVEKQQGVYDWSHYDSRLKYVVDQGLELELKIATKDRPDWLKEPWVARIPDGRYAHPQDPSTECVVTFASDEFNELQAGFMKAVAAHFKEIGLDVLTYTPVFGGYGETEYECWTYTDYSRYAQDQFRQWLKERYQNDLAKLNSAWMSEFAAWDDVKIKYDGTRYSKVQPDLRPWYLDFVEYREWSLGRMLSVLARGLREGDPDAVVGAQLGRIFSVECAMRGTFGVFGWTKDIDMLLVDPSPLNDVVAAVDQVRASGKLLALELDGPYAYVRDKVAMDENYAQQAGQAFAAGSAIVYTANWGTRIMNTWPGTTSQFAAVRDVPAMQPIADEAVFQSKWGLYAFHEHDYGQFDFRPEGAKGRPIDVITDELILADAQLLSKYRKIHVHFAPVVSRKLFESLQQNKDRLVVTDERFGKVLIDR